jgi:hypothetical protein
LESSIADHSSGIEDPGVAFVSLVSQPFGAQHVDVRGTSLLEVPEGDGAGSERDRSQRLGEDIFFFFVVVAQVFEDFGRRGFGGGGRMLIGHDGGRCKDM